MPRADDVHDNLAGLLAGRGRLTEAYAHWRTALRLQPDSALAANNFAWQLATAADGAFRNGQEAVALAERACRLSPDQPAMLDTLAAAYAEAGRLPEAAATAEKALAKVVDADRAPLTAEIRSRLNAYRAGRPYRQGQ